MIFATAIAPGAWLTDLGGMDSLNVRLDPAGVVLRVHQPPACVSRPRLLALNKVDLLSEDERRALSFRHPRAVQVSAASGEGLEELSDAIEARFLSSLRPMELLVPYGEGGRLSELHDLAGEMSREDTAEGVRVRARVPAGVASRFERFEVNGKP